jgi:glycosyltransferase involved in cell wall biosynthesis
MIFARRQAESLQRVGVEVDLFHLRSRTLPWELAREWVRFRRRARSFEPQVIHAHYGTVTALFAAGAAGSTPLVITFRGSDLNASVSLRSAAGLVLSQVAALRAGRIVCVSRQLRKRLWWRRENVIILPSGVDPEVFRPQARAQARQRLGWDQRERVVLFNAGHAAAGKRADLAMEALALTQGLLSGVRMEVLDGATPPQRIPGLLNAADCLLLTSDREGSPTVVQEALACNLPVISVEVGDCVERLRGVRRSAIVPREAAAIAIELARVLRTPGRSDGRRKVEEFSAHGIAGELCRIYRELAGPGFENSAWNISLY